MGLDLTIHIRDSALWPSDGEFTSRNVLHFDRNSEVFEALRDQPEIQTIPLGISLGVCDDDEGYQTTRDNPYGETLCCSTTGGLFAALSRVWPEPERYSWNQAIFAFLEAIPSDYLVIVEFN